MAFVTANGVRLHVQRFPGDGPPLVFVHGLIDTLACYYFTLAGPVHALGYDVVTYDLRGHGRSERPPHGYSVDDAVDDLHALIGELGITEPVHLIGFSYGGTVLFRYAYRYPGSVASMVVIDSEPPTVAWAQHMLDELQKAAAYIYEPEVIGKEPPLFQKMSAQARKMADNTTLGADLVAPTPLMTAGEVAAIDVPLLLVVAGAGRLRKRLDMVVPMLPPCTVEVIPGDDDHLILLTSPEKVCATILPWLADRLPASVG
jgi:pimeloyl-ACP methyl ester carboxylesterase